MSFKKKYLRILRNYLYRRYQKAGRQFRQVNRAFLHSLSGEPDPIQSATTITDRSASNDWQQLQPVWVLSTGRTGTHTLTKLLNQSPFLDARHEPSPELFAFSYDYYSGTIERQRALQSLEYLRDELVFRSFRDGFVYVETNNRLSYLAELLLELYPQSKFIFIHRNPYKYIRSGMRRNYYNGHLLDSARIIPNPSSEYADRWETMSTLEKVAWNWAAVNEICLNFIEKLPAKQQMVFSSESLFDADPALAKNLFNFTGSSQFHPPSGDIKRVMGKKYNAQKKGSFPRPKEWTVQQVSNVNGIIRPVAQRLGYQLLNNEAKKIGW